ncbi:N-acetyl-D-glucosamine kinase isoform X2 [Cephus cinctus]|nr:N-acetyl-D-glucosamine kinase isoform X2 [Cephus cinctus]XP_015604182.1 N-acetyl-D-glucosamine kinase isoform X2 [Cephus cinctus]XP_015604183.1 N-acetyl-D-glucosamine kinase isoform X2 [Cephus cinctus]XP_015604184.1 N-acetyl-D-glucosamine kinase isoform X2 [Cephus cinctus]XP_024945071.1 N-acetyl-D-glucosamine kinase isoform X2 [Cephus cinctus]XP_024945072.1 N-acetyl-D-glucosamine kinase isoform X2 [Cephus cinctus]
MAEQEKKNQLSEGIEGKPKQTDASSPQEVSDVGEIDEDLLKKKAEDVRIGGIEGGATHSTLIVVDGSGNKLSELKGPGTNHWQLGIPETVARINGMISRIKTELKIPEKTPLDCVGLSLSGCEEKETDRIIKESLLRDYPNASKNYIVSSDTLGSMKTGLENGGIVLIAGTGSNALLINPDGKTYGCGGWGHVIGDEGSAYYIAHRACKYVFDDLDDLKKAPYPITYVWPALKNFFHVADRHALLSHLYSNFEKVSFAKFAKEIATGCENKDPLCLDIFRENGEYLAMHVIALAKKAHNDLLLSPGGLKVICVGSVWKSWNFIKTGFTEAIHASNIIDELTLHHLTTSSAIGACYLAADHVKEIRLKKNYANNIDSFYHYKRNNYSGIPDFSIPEKSVASLWGVCRGPCNKS